MPAIDLSFQSGKTHRNRGLCSLPRAYAWMEFASVRLEEWKDYAISLSTKSIEGVVDDDSSWTKRMSSSGDDIKEALERAITCLTRTPPDELGVGSHFMHVLLQNTGTSDGMMECPSTGQELRVTMHDQSAWGNEDESPPGILQVIISTSMAGSESEYLPEVYRSLFMDESLRRPAYAKFKARQEKRRQQQQQAREL